MITFSISTDLNTARLFYKLI